MMIIIYITVSNLQQLDPAQSQKKELLLGCHDTIDIYICIELEYKQQNWEIDLNIQSITNDSL